MIHIKAFYLKTNRKKAYRYKNRKLQLGVMSLLAEYYSPKFPMINSPCHFFQVPTGMNIN